MAALLTAGGLHLSTGGAAGAAQVWIYGVAFNPSEAAGLLDLNDDRAGSGRHPLYVHADLQARANDWAAVLASEGRLRHSRLGEGLAPGWRLLAENVGVSDSVWGADDLFWLSPPHRANMVDARFSHVGVGTAWRGNQLYVVQLFALY